MTNKRKRIARYGPHGGRVSVFEEPDCYRVEWRDGHRRRKKFLRGKEGKRRATAFAKGLAYERDVLKVGGITVRELWLRYTSSPSYQRLRPRTQELYAQRWSRWEIHLRHNRIVQNVGPRDADDFIGALRKRAMAPNQISEHLKMAKLVHAWAMSRELTNHNRLAGYRFKLGTDEKRQEPEEYRWEDFERIVAQFDPQNSRQWRPSAVLMLIGHQGVRSRAARHLQWDDVDLKRGVIRWNPVFDKLGKDWTQPIRDGARAALFTAWYWREQQGETGPWVFYSSWGLKKRKGREIPGVYGAQALWKALRQAEAAAGVPSLPLRSVHGLRRMVAGQVLEETGDPVLAMQFIGDSDLRMVTKYLKRREDRLRAAAELLDRKGPQDVTRGLVKV